MRHSFQVRVAEAGDANRIAVLAVQVWLHTYATDGISDETARYVRSEFTPEKYLKSLNDQETHFFVAERDENLVGFAAIKVGRWFATSSRKFWLSRQKLVAAARNCR